MIMKEINAMAFCLTCNGEISFTSTTIVRGGAIPGRRGIKSGYTANRAILCFRNPCRPLHVSGDFLLRNNPTEPHGHRPISGESLLNEDADIFAEDGPEYIIGDIWADAPPEIDSAGGSTAGGFNASGDDY